MSEVVIAENINCNDEEQVYKYTIDMIDINTILFSIMNTDTGINYKLHIKKNSEWCKENLYKTQNDFSQLYQMLNDCIINDSSMFKYELKEETDHIDFKMEMKNDTKFFKLDLEFKLERHISDNGIIDDRLNSIEYQFNIYKDKTNETIQKLQDDNEILKKQVSELVNIHKKQSESKNKELAWLNTRWVDSSAENSINWGGGRNELPSSNLCWQNPSGSHPGFVQTNFLDIAIGNCSDLSALKCFMKRWFQFHMGVLNI
jgi:hypothetical protein